MSNSDQTRDASVLNDSTHGEVGDVEDAGETTAADTITGPVETRPVGSDTMLKVSAETDKKSADE
jgi:hypothetical protein